MISPGGRTDPDGTMREEAPVQFYLRGSYIGDAELDLALLPLAIRWQSLAYFCPLCGEIWARAVLLRAQAEAITFIPLEVPCERHPWQWGVAGSLLEPRQDCLIPYLPPAVLRREFQLHLREKGLS